MVWELRGDVWFNWTARLFSSSGASVRFGQALRIARRTKLDRIQMCAVIWLFLPVAVLISNVLFNIILRYIIIFLYYANFQLSIYSNSLLSDLLAWDLLYG